MTDEILEAVRYRLEQEHPVMAAMATKLERKTKRKSNSAEVRVTFDGPALPEQLHFAFLVTLGTFREQIRPALIECERQIAAAMKRAGYGGGLG